MPALGVTGEVSRSITPFGNPGVHGWPASMISEFGTLVGDDLLREGNLPPGLCFYKGCMKSGHRWDRCLCHV